MLGSYSEHQMQHAKFTLRLQLRDSIREQVGHWRGWEKGRRNKLFQMNTLSRDLEQNSDLWQSMDLSKYY